jgi:hypothetical protein
MVCDWLRADSSSSCTGPNGAARGVSDCPAFGYGKCEVGTGVALEERRSHPGPNAPTPHPVTPMRSSPPPFAGFRSASSPPAPRPPGPRNRLAAPRAARWRSTVAKCVLRAVGDSAAVTAAMGAERTSTPTLTLVSESRHLNDAPVLDAAALSRGSIRAVAPGSAIHRGERVRRGRRCGSRSAPPRDRPLVVAARRRASAMATRAALRGFGLAGSPPSRSATRGPPCSAATARTSSSPSLDGRAGLRHGDGPPGGARGRRGRGGRARGYTAAAGATFASRLGQSVRLDAATAHACASRRSRGRATRSPSSTRARRSAPHRLRRVRERAARYTVVILRGGDGGSHRRSAAAGRASLTVATAPTPRKLDEGTERVFGAHDPWRAGGRCLAARRRHGGPHPAD